MIYGLAGIAAAAIIVYRIIQNYLDRKELAALRASNDKEKQDFHAQVDKATKEIADAKADYDRARRELDNP